MENKTSESQLRANSRYVKTRDNLMLRPTKEEGQLIRAAAEAAGQSVQAYCLEAIRARMEKENGSK